MTRITYKLTKRTTKTEKFEKSLNNYKTIIFKTISYKLTVSGKNNNLIVNYNFMRPVRILRLPKNLKKMQKQQTQKN